jgi:folate-binding protein YgfZ
MTHPLFTSILVSGIDARTFLQGQLSCDIDTLAQDKPLLASLNSPQGRVQAVLNLIERDDGIVLSVASSIAERTVQRLRKYVLRSKVKIELVNADTVTPALAGVQEIDVQNKLDSRLRGNDGNTVHAGIVVQSESLLSQLRAGIPHVFPETHEAFVAQMLNLDVLGGISFEKGCYTGQEIIARTHFRGAVKRRMFRFAANCLPPVPGARVLANKEHAGDVVYAAATEQGCELLAVISLAQVDAALTVENAAALTKLELPYSVS